MLPQTYVPSGIVGPLSIPFGLLVGLVTAVAGGFGYQWAIDHLPVAGVGIVLGAILGAIVGTCTSAGLRIGKLRNRNIAVVLLATLGLVAVGFSWAAAYEDGVRRVVNSTHLPRDQVTAELPVATWLYYKLHGGYAVVNGAAFARHGNEVRFQGVLALLFWLGEALLIAGVAIAVGVPRICEPFCERCSRWTEPHRRIQRKLEQVGVLPPRVAEGLSEPLLELMRRGQGWILHTLHCCPRCQDTAYLTAAFSARGHTGSVALATYMEISATQRDGLLTLPAPIRHR